ncbi:MAG: glucose-1-phosphate cytidylyltransferase [Gammaproteobacteria bacterium]|nr:glucose-1-phosphate cytidylyltransferase [Gammaproteobacteria bacterium]
MKVVLFCGGMGTRLREQSGTIPKPLVPVGERPIMWHMMKFYAHHGHTDFILCLGYKGEMIKEYFLDYKAYRGAEFVTKNKGKVTVPNDSDVDDWNITFVQTGLHSNIGQRLLAVKHLLKDEEIFMANYSDQLSDVDLSEYLRLFEQRKDAVAGIVGVRPSQSFHNVRINDSGNVTKIEPVAVSDFWINGGYIVMRNEIFDYIKDGEELVEEPFQRLISEKRLFAYKYKGFWAAMDTFKDKITFDRMDGQGDRPWQVWDK